MKLHQVNALVTGRKSTAEKTVGDLYKLLQKDALFDGMERVYKPMDEETGERLPPEKQKVQFRAIDVVAAATQTWTELWDLTATQDSGNQTARADIVVDGTAVLTGVPVTTLLFLEKQLNDVETFINKLPTPEASEDWDYDSNTDLLRSRPAQSVRTKKVPRNHVKAPATTQHPAQVEVYHEDVQVGTWTKVSFTGRLPAKEKNAMLARVKKLKDAVKLARENANALDTAPRHVGEALLRFVFGPST